jgi:hypothetical protein
MIVFLEPFLGISYTIRFCNLGFLQISYLNLPMLSNNFFRVLRITTHLFIKCQDYRRTILIVLILREMVNDHSRFKLLGKNKK